MYEVYAIETVEPQETVYVGVTKKSAQERYEEHLHAARKRKHHNAALSRILREYETRYVVLEAVEERSRSSKAERAWIARFRSMGIQLCNRTTGGYGWPRTDDELFSKAVSEGLQKRSLSEIEEHKRAISEALKGRSLSEAHKRKLSRHKCSEEHKRAISEAHKGIPLSEEHKRAISEARKGCKFSEEHKRAIGDCQRGRKKGPLSDEHKRAISETRMGHSVSEKTKRKISEAFKGVPLSEEHKCAISEAQRRERPCKYSCGFVGNGYQMMSHIQWHCPNAPKKKEQDEF